MITPIIEKPVSNIDYAQIMEGSGFEIDTNDYYLFTKNIPTATDWVLHLSIVLPEINQVLEKLIPILRYYHVPFSMAKNEECANYILHGVLGYPFFAKVITLYPNGIEQTLKLAEDVIRATTGIKGPEIPTAAPIGSVVYADYLGTTPFEPSMWPFNIKMPVPKTQHKQIFQGKYMILDTLKTDVKGNVYKGIYLHRFMIRKCVIKQGRKYMFTDHGKRDMSDRMEWQKQMLLDLRALVHVPRYIDLFIYEGDCYLVMEYINGPQFTDIVINLYKERKWNQLQIKEQQKLLDYLIRMVKIVITLNQHGYIHRDVTPANFLLDQKGKIVLIDMEMAYLETKNYPEPPFGNGTTGFMSPQQLAQQRPTVAEDVYGIGGMLVHFFTAHTPVLFRYQNPDELVEDLKPYHIPAQVITIIKGCYDPEPENRPTLQQIYAELELTMKALM